MLKKYQTLLLILLAYITIFAFYPSITSNFINLDDMVMVTDNPDITSLSFSNIKHIFSTIHYRLYHPIVTLSYAIEYYFCKLDPYLYHVDNLLLHLLNTLLAFFIIYKLSKSFFVSYIVAILFAVHPTHVEVVSWITSRKDTLYSFFFLLSVLFYINIDDVKHRKLFFILSLFSFLLSCLSKPMAVTLPVILILIDFYRNKLNVNSIKKYIPYLILTFIFIYLALVTHYSPDDKDITTFFIRFTDFLDTHFHYLFYICKCVLPINLSCIYTNFYNHNWCVVPKFIIYSATMLYLLILLVIFSLKFNKKTFFGFFFFLITLLPSSGIMPTGVSPVADRYVYIPYIGLFYIFAEFLFYIYKKNQILKYVSIISVCIIGLALSYLTYQRSLLWSDNEKLMTQAINCSPATADIAYLLRGCVYKDQNLLDLAEKDLLKSYYINKQNAAIVYYLGDLRQKQKKYKEARQYYSIIPFSSFNFIAAINNLALIYDEEKDTNKAIDIMEKTLQKKECLVQSIPDYFYHTLSVLYVKNKNFDNALKNLELAIKINPYNYIYYVIQMDIYLKKDDFSSFEKVGLEGLKKTNLDNNILMFLSKEYFLRKDYNQAEKYLKKIIEFHPNNHFACFLLGNIFAIKTEYKKALICYTMAILLSKDNGEYYFKRAAIYLTLNKYELAKKDIEKAEQKGFVVDKEFKKDLENIK